MVSRLVSSRLKLEFGHSFVFFCCSHVSSDPRAVQLSPPTPASLALNVPSSCSTKTRLSLAFAANVYVGIVNRISGSGCWLLHFDSFSLVSRQACDCGDPSLWLDARPGAGTDHTPQRKRRILERTPVRLQDGQPGPAPGWDGRRFARFLRVPARSDASHLWIGVFSSL